MEDLTAVPLRAPNRGGRSVTVLVVADIMNSEEEDLELARVIANDFVKRDEYGYEKYGQNLETHDGRPTIWDLYQELLDACQYQRKLIEEGEMPVEMAPVYPTLLYLTRMTRKAIINKEGEAEALTWRKADEETEECDTEPIRVPDDTPAEGDRGTT